MEENVHPLEGFMSLTMENLKQMIEVDTAIGKPIDAPDGSLIIPLSKVKFGFASGGSEFLGKDQKSQDQNSDMIIPFGGGSGGGVSITPAAFLVANKSGVELITLNESTHVYEKMLEKGPQFIDQIMGMIKQDSDRNSDNEKDSDKGRSSR
ncbi:sporulation protein YtfJ [Gracilibacillus ureilyticus]|uniref:Sporulation protein YtfJ n=1 Tax=Gracilibacillus ureilyticus TaxID=531814 RepID=A0A1H9UD11_9BACI|nr:GerW family sporulation protein [Gracilibacillus ureilyticus]SES07239.1 sporulation protein YtfJ [Gracilibacillus ureilyticus]